jgi:uncharacterized protein YneF (UPF0154 family)
VPDELFCDALIAYLVQYVGLGAVFFFGLFVAVRQADVGLATPRQRRWLAVLLGGFVLYAGLHGFFQFLGPSL